jgi:hypothetical protein
MKNTECIISITTKNGYKQIYQKDNNIWTQTSPNGIVRKMTAEQLLSHLLPPLTASSKSNLTVKVELKNRMKEDATKKIKKKDIKKVEK